MLFNKLALHFEQQCITVEWGRGESWFSKVSIEVLRYTVERRERTSI